jgi:hypothetical protein
MHFVWSKVARAHARTHRRKARGSEAGAARSTAASLRDASSCVA